MRDSDIFKKLKNNYFLIQFSTKIDVLDYADNYFEFLKQLEILTGKKVDLVSKKSLKNPILIEEIERSKVEIFAAQDFTINSLENTFVLSKIRIHRKFKLVNKDLFERIYVILFIENKHRFFIVD